MSDVGEPMVDATNWRQVDIRISAAAEIGFVAWENGTIVAAFTSRAEIADWIEQRLGLLPGEVEREARELEAYRTAMDNVEKFPRVASPRTDPPARRTRRLFGG